jgi:hypothetical protein
MGSDPERDRRRQEEADRLGITPEELRARRKAEQEAALEEKAGAHGVTVDEYVAEHRKKKRGGRPWKGTTTTPKAEPTDPS